MAIEQLDILIAWLLLQCFCPLLCSSPWRHFRCLCYRNPGSRFPSLTTVRFLLLCIILYL